MNEDENKVDVDTENHEDGDSSKTEDINNAEKSELAKVKRIAEDQRKRAEKAEAELKSKKGYKEQSFDPEEIKKQAQEAVRNEADSEFLDESDYSDELKEQLKAHAKATGATVRSTVKGDFGKFLVERAIAKQRADEAANNGNRKGRSAGVTDPTVPLNPEDFDLSTEEGRKEWDDAKKARAKARA
jgi:hypothetical protein